MKLLSTSDAASKLGLTMARVQQLIWAGRLPAQKIGHSYVINEADLKLVAERKKGRPPTVRKHLSKSRKKNSDKRSAEGGSANYEKKEKRKSED